ncbi:MAG: ATP-binding cassette domain-containing protein [Gammaproteobacteria bacterium]
MLPLVIAGLSYARGGETLLHALSCVIEASGNTVVLGPNGAGKSLLLRLCHGLLRPSSGKITWGGPDAARAAERQAMVFQRPVLLRRTAAENIDYALRLRGTAASQRRVLVEEALNMAGLAALARRQARVLSGGEQQRLALARAWATRPEVLFLDESTAHLDPAATRAVEAMIGDFRKQGLKIILATHDLAQARRLADDVLFLHRGRLLERAPAARFFERPDHPDARAFLRGDLLW